MRVATRRKGAMCHLEGEYSRILLKTLAGSRSSRDILNILECSFIILERLNILDVMDQLIYARAILDFACAIPRRPFAKGCSIP